jgi:hypothetical protein
MFVQYKKIEKHISVVHITQMSSQVKHAVEPIRIVLFRPNCLYCDKPYTYYSECVYKFGVIGCKEHTKQAERDAKAWLHRNNRVKYNDYLEDPLFQRTDLLRCPIKVKRTSGAIDEHGWTILKPTFGVDGVLEYVEGTWCIPVIHMEKDIKKYIPVVELKMSTTESELVDAFISRLDTGFYVKEAEAYEEALILEQEMENPNNNGRRVEDNIHIISHPIYGIGRMFIPPKVETGANPVA